MAGDEVRDEAEPHTLRDRLSDINGSVRFVIDEHWVWATTALFGNKKKRRARMVRIMGILVGSVVMLACTGGGSDSTPIIGATDVHTPAGDPETEAVAPAAPSIEGRWMGSVPAGNNAIIIYTLVGVDPDGTAHYTWDSTDPAGDQYNGTGTATVASDGNISGEGCAPVGCLIFNSELSFDGNTMSGTSGPAEGYSGNESYFEDVRE